MYYDKVMGFLSTSTQTFHATSSKKLICYPQKKKKKKVNKLVIFFQFMIYMPLTLFSSTSIIILAYALISHL